MTDSYPRLAARTRRFSLGVPRDITIAPDGSRVVFLRTRSGTDPVTCLWELDVASGVERLVVDPRTVAVDTEERLPPEERARRERARESASGIVAYASDADLASVAFALGGTLWVCQLATGATRRLATGTGVNDPQLSPDGSHVSYVLDGALHVQSVGDGADRVLAAPDGEDVTWGLAEFIAAEELDRMRGAWWSPDGHRILAQRTDESHVQAWWIGDPADPADEPVLHRYPAAGTANASVTLWLLGLDGTRMPVYLDDEYVSEVTWDATALSVTTLSRDQREQRVSTVDAGTGATRLAWSGSDGAWMDVRPGLPMHLTDGATVWLVDAEDSCRLLVGDRPVTRAGLQVREVTSVDGDVVVFRASPEPTSVELWAYDASDDGLTRLSPSGPGVWGGRRRGGTLVLTGHTLDRSGVVVTVRRGDVERVVGSLAEEAGVAPAPTLLRVGPRELPTAVLLPTGHVPGSARLPVILDPYGGPGHARVIAARGAYLTSQWLADQGFAVVVADGRGVPGRGPGWERLVAGDLARFALEDQVDALLGVAAAYPDDLDLGRVAIRGWSFGGFLAALAVLRRPDVFHAAVAGAPVTDWRLYDTAYTERYLGHPDVTPETYERSSLMGDAAGLARPMLLIHGLADDNVVAAHTLRLSAALLAAGRPHTVLPIPGATHMANDEAVAANLLELEVRFLRESLGVPLP